MPYTDRNKICNKLDEVENYEQAKKDNFKGWILHHKQGLYMSIEEMEELGWYYDCPPDCLIFLKRSEHFKTHHKSKYWAKYERMRTYWLQGYTLEKKLKTRNKTEFSTKYYEHYKLFKKDNIALYQRELRYYNKHNEVSWEV